MTAAHRDGQHVPTRSNTQRPHIVVGLDETAASHAALRWAIDRAAETGHPVSAVYVYDTPPTPALRSHAVRHTRESHARARATTWLRDVAADAPAARARLVVAEGSPVKVLLAASRSADLMVLGAPRRGRLRRVLTNRVARRCSGRARCPVVLIPPASERGDPDDQTHLGEREEAPE